MRTFVAVDFDESIRRRLGAVQTRLQSQCPGLKWVAPNQIHLTLKFLGEVRDQQVADVSSRLEEVASRHSPFDVEVAGLGVFNPSGPVRVVWVGISDPDGHLARCQADCEASLAEIGFPPEGRAFSPHLTLARNRDASRSRQIREALVSQGTWQAGVQHVSGLTFYQSTLSPAGALYHALSHHSLVKRSPGEDAPRHGRHNA